MPSFRALAQQIDFLYPPSSSLREFAGRFRYTDLPLGSIPPGPISLRELSNRLTGPQTIKVEFLHLNCWLLPATFGIKEVIESFGSLAILVACLELRAVDVLVKLLEKIDTSKICDTFFPKIVAPCGVSPDLLYDGCVAVLGSTLKLADWLLNAAGWTLQEAIDILDIPTNYIADALGLNIDIKEKPEMGNRAVEIGDNVWKYDIASLVEVWNEAMQLDILRRGGNPDPSLFETYKGKYTSGPTRTAGSWKQLDSGIFVLVPKLRIVDQAAEVYRADGHHSTTGCDYGPIVDTDRWAEKGVQLTRIDVGCGVIDLYTTHIYSGGDPLLPNWASWVFDKPPNDSEIATTREAQVTQLCEFITRTHHGHESNIIIVAGDFNIPGRFTVSSDGKPQYDPQYESLRDAMAKLNLDDWWEQTPFKSVVNAYGNEGITNRHGDGDKPYFNRFDMVCKPYPQKTNLPNQELLKPVPADIPGYCDYFCDDQQPSTDLRLDGPGNRIDYIFVERLSRQHSLSVQCTRLRRRAFRKAGSQNAVVPEVSDDNSVQVHLSDHLGLENDALRSPSKASCQCVTGLTQRRHGAESGRI